MSAPFFRPAKAGYRVNTADATGKVRVTVTLMGEKSQHVKGNITRTMVVADATVSAVADAISTALFGEGG